MSRRKIADIGEVTIYRDSETREYVVRPSEDSGDRRAYFTEEKDDAYGTAHHMDDQIKRKTRARASVLSMRRRNPIQRDNNAKKRFHIFIPPGTGGMEYGWDGRTPVPMRVTFAVNAPKRARYVWGLASRMVNTPGFQYWYKHSNRELYGTQSEIIEQLERFARAGGEPTKNPIRVRRGGKYVKQARKMVRKYGKGRARRIAGGMIGRAKSRRQKEHFVGVRRAINPTYKSESEWRGDARGRGYKVRRSDVGDSLVAYTGRGTNTSPYVFRGQYDLVTRGGYLKDDPQRRRNPVRVQRGSSRDEYKLFTRRTTGAKWVLAMTTNSLKELLRTALKMREKGYGVRVVRA